MLELQIKDLCVGYNGKEILHNISLDIENGSFIAIVVLLVGILPETKDLPKKTGPVAAAGILQSLRFKELSCSLRLRMCKKSFAVCIFHNVSGFNHQNLIC